MSKYSRMARTVWFAAGTALVGVSGGCTGNQTGPISALMVDFARSLLAALLL